jgi:hypothetical protein
MKPLGTKCWTVLIFVPCLRGRDELPLIRFCLPRYDSVKLALGRINLTGHAPADEQAAVVTLWRALAVGSDTLKPWPLRSPAAEGVVGRSSLPFLIPYRYFGLLRSDYTILIIAAVEAIINKLRMNTGSFRLL